MVSPFLVTCLEYTEEVANTHRSDDLMNTSTELEPTSRQSMHPSFKASNFSPSPPPKNRMADGRSLNKVNQKPTIKQLAQQPGYIDKDDMIIELPNREELMSNSKSREPTIKNERRSMMESRYGEDEHKFDTYGTLEATDDQSQVDRSQLGHSSST